MGKALGGGGGDGESDGDSVIKALVDEAEMDGDTTRLGAVRCWSGCREGGESPWESPGAQGDRCGAISSQARDIINYANENGHMGENHS